MQWTTDDILVATAGEWICGNQNVRFSGIAIDSRRILLSEFFVAIRGEFHDGHRFCAEVVQSGVKGVLIDVHSIETLPVAEWRQQGIACIGVKDTTRALGRSGGLSQASLFPIGCGDNRIKRENDHPQYDFGYSLPPFQSPFDSRKF